MHTSFKTLGTLALIGLAACGRKPAAELSPVDNVVATRWNGNLTTPAAMQGIIQSEGRAWITSENDGRKIRVDVELSNMVPGGEHPWVLRTGQCGMSGADLVRVTDRNRLKVGSDGKARAKVSSDMQFPSSGDYMLAVMASNDNPDRIIACGNLAPPNMLPRR